MSRRIIAERLLKKRRLHGTGFSPGKERLSGTNPPSLVMKGGKRGVVVVQVAVLLTVLLGFAALTIDAGVMYNTRGDLQRTADAASLAAAARLSDYSTGDPLPLARDAAVEYVQRNRVFSKTMTLDPSSDVVFGQATYDEQSHSYTFIPTEELPNALRLTVRHTADSSNGAVPLFFANVFGISDADLSARATAVMVPRDIAVVADMSASHTDDSELRHYRQTDVNLYNVWDNWPGGIDDGEGSIWDPNEIPPEWWDGNGNAPQAAGPAWGYLKKLGYGTEQIAQNYDPVADPGLIQLPFNQNWSDAKLRSYLFDRGYIQSEVDALMSKQYDPNGAWYYRVSAAMGWAYWNSGQPGGLWEKRGVRGGNGNNWVGSNELEWTETIGNRDLQTSRLFWLYYTLYTGSDTMMTRTNSNFRFRFGVKTMMNYFMEWFPDNQSTPELSNTPEQPMQAVKDAVNHLVDYLDALNTDDQLSLEIYGTTARHEVDMSLNLPQVSNRLNAMQAAHYDGWTNMGGGLTRAIEELTSSRARSASKKMIILLTDGNANVTRDGRIGDPDGGAVYALEEAQAAADLGIKIFAVSVGVDANQSLMDQIAEIGSGEHFHAEGSIEQYSDQLEEIFRRIGGKRPVELIE